MGRRAEAAGLGARAAKGVVREGVAVATVGASDLARAVVLTAEALAPVRAVERMVVVTAEALAPARAVASERAARARAEGAWVRVASAKEGLAMPAEREASVRELALERAMGTAKGIAPADKIGQSEGIPLTLGLAMVGARGQSAGTLSVPGKEVASRPASSGPPQTPSSGLKKLAEARDL